MIMSEATHGGEIDRFDGRRTSRVVRARGKAIGMGSLAARFESLSLTGALLANALLCGAYLPGVLFLKR